MVGPTIYTSYMQYVDTEALLAGGKISVDSKHVWWRSLSF